MRKLSVSVLVFLAAVCLLVSPAVAVKITLIGEINDNEQFVADGETYEVDNNAAGDDLVLNHAGKKVKVIGQFKVTRQHKIIEVDSFEILEE